MLQFFRKAKGSVSLILILVLLPIMTYATMIVDGTRIMSAKTAVSGAGDLTMNAALSTYDQALKDAYGLFAMCDNLDDLQDNFTEYFASTLEGNLAAVNGYDNDVDKFINTMTGTVQSSLFRGENVDADEMVNHLAMEVQAITVSGNSSSTLSNPDVMKRQIVEYMKYKAPIMAAASIMDKIQMFSSANKQTKAIEKQMDYTKTSATLQEACKQAKDALFAYNDAVIDLENTMKMDALNKNIGNASSTDTLYSNLQDATKNLLIYQNLVKKYFNEKNETYIPLVPQVDKLSFDDFKKENFSGYELNNPGSGREYGNNAIKGTLNPNNKTAIPSDIQNVLNQPVNSENSNTNTLIKDIADGYEAVFAAKANYEEAKKAYNSKKEDINELNQKLSGVKGTDVALINSYYNEIASKYKIDDLRSRCFTQEYYDGMFQVYDKQIKSLETAVDGKNRSFKDLYSFGADGIQLKDESSDEYQKLDDNQKNAYLVWKLWVNMLQKCGVKITGLADGFTFIWDEQSKYEAAQKESQIRGQLQSLDENCAKVRDGYKTNADEAYENAYEKVKDVITKVNTVKDKASECVTKLNEVKTKAGEVEKSLNDWQQGINGVPAGTTRDSMQSQHDAEAEKIKVIEVESLLNYVSKQKTGYENLSTYLESIKYFGDSIMHNALSADTYCNSEAGGKWKDQNIDANLDSITENAALAKAAELMNNNFTCSVGKVNGVPENIQKDVLTKDQKYLQLGFPNDEIKDGDKRNGYLVDLYFTGEDSAKAFYIKLINITKKLQNNNENQSKNNIENLKNDDPQSSSKAPKSKQNTKQEDIVNSAPNDSNGKSRTKGSITGGVNGITYAGSTAGINAKTDVSNPGVDSLGTVKGSDNNDSLKENQTDLDAKKNQMTSAASFMDTIASLANSVVSLAYEEEYFTNMFSCYTTDIEDGIVKTGTEVETSLENIPLNNNYHYMYEQEYIIWGGSPDSAVTKTMASIYGIRFVMNLIYAFTSAEVQGIACEIATAIAGWTVFGIPIVQAIVTVVLALAESGIDLYQLSQGFDVPIFKTSSTWTCSLSGAAKFATNTALQKGTELLTNVANDMVDDASESIDNFVNSQIDNAVNSLKSTLSDAISSAVVTFYAETGLSEFQNQIKSGSEDVKSKVTSAVNNVKEIIQSSNAPDAVKTAEQAMLDEIGIENLVNQMTSELKNNVDALNQDNVVTKIQKLVIEKVDQLVGEVKNTASKVIEDGTNEIKDAVNDFAKEKSEDLKQKASDAIDKYLDSGKSSGQVDANEKGKGGVTMNYKQYVKLFTLVGLISNERVMLQRCAALVQTNMNLGGAAINSSDKKDYDLQNAYTLTEIDADVQLKTIFSYDAKVEDTESTEDEGLYSGLGSLWGNSGESTLHYHSVMGF